MKAQAQRRTVWRLLTLALPFWRGMALSALLGALTILSSVALLATSAWLISKAALRPSIAELSVAVVGVRFFGIARAVLRYLERLAAHGTTFRLLARLRVDFYRLLEPLAPARLNAYRSGDLLARVVDDIESQQNIYLRALTPPLVALLVALAATAFLAAFDPLTAAVALAGFGLGAALPPLLALQGGRGPGRDLVTARAELNAAAVEQVQSLADSLVYGVVERQLAALDALSERLAAAELRLARVDAAQMALGLLLVNGAALVVLAAAIPRVEGVYLATLALATVAAFEAITPLAAAAAHLGSSLAAADRLFALADQPPAVHDPPQAGALPVGRGLALTLRDVRLRYEPDTSPALDGLTLDIPAGAKVAIVGSSGSGKSSLVNALARFWDYEGSIRLGGVELRTLTQAQARGLLAVMTQRPHLFNTTVRENITIGRDTADESAVAAAAQVVQLHDLIAALPAGYATFTGEGGGQFSAGERQRIALARVLVRDAPVWVLDEPTANLDADTEAALLEALLAVAEGRTLIVLTHRLNRLERFDQIVALAAGRVAEQGTHADLLARGGLYRRLYDQQGSAF